MQLFETLWTAAHQASLSFTTSQSLLKLLALESVIPSHHLILCHPLLLLPSIFPSIRVFSNESTLCQVAKVLELQVQHQSFHWIFRVDFLWDWLVWSPCSTRDSQESLSAPQFKSINFLVLRLLYGPTLTCVHDYWKNHIAVCSIIQSCQTLCNPMDCSTVFPMSIQGQFPLRLTGLISLVSKGLSGVFSSTIVRRHQFFSPPPSLWSSSHNHTWPLGRP